MVFLCSYSTKESLLAISKVVVLVIYFGGEIHRFRLIWAIFNRVNRGTNDLTDGQEIGRKLCIHCLLFDIQRSLVVLTLDICRQSSYHIHGGWQIFLINWHISRGLRPFRLSWRQMQMLAEVKKIILVGAGISLTSRRLFSYVSKVRCWPLLQSLTFRRQSVLFNTFLS